MTSKNGYDVASREDVLSDFTAEPEMNQSVLGSYIEQYPEHCKDLLAVFNELEMARLEEIAND